MFVNLFNRLENERVNTKILDRKLNIFKSTRRFLDQRELVVNNNYNGVNFKYEKDVKLDFSGVIDGKEIYITNIICTKGIYSM